MGFFEKLKENPYLEKKGETESVTEHPQEMTELSDISAEEFGKMIARLEEAAYALLEEEVLILLSELESKSYCGKALKPLLVQVRRKAEASDCISAVELVSKVKKGLE